MPWLLELLEENGHPYGADDYESNRVHEYTCPHCQASDRDRMYAVWIDRNHHRDQRLLEVGPQPAFERFLRQRFDYRSLDQDERADDIGDVEELPYPDDSFDAFVCSHVLEHVYDDRRAIRELRRILKPGGWGILMVPVCLSAREIDETPVPVSAEEGWRRFAQYDHVRLYTKAGWLERVTEGGFTVREVAFDPVTRWRYALPSGVLYVVTRA